MLQTVLPHPFRQISYISLGQFLNFAQLMKIEIVEIVCKPFCVYRSSFKTRVPFSIILQYTKASVEGLTDPNFSERGEGIYHEIVLNHLLKKKGLKVVTITSGMPT